MKLICGSWNVLSCFNSTIIVTDSPTGGSSLPLHHLFSLSTHSSSLPSSAPLGISNAFQLFCIFCSQKNKMFICLCFGILIAPPCHRLLPNWQCASAPSLSVQLAFPWLAFLLAFLFCICHFNTKLNLISFFCVTLLCFDCFYFVSFLLLLFISYCCLIEREIAVDWLFCMRFVRAEDL